MTSSKKTHSYWNGCHNYSRFRDTSIRVEKFSEVTCKFCIKLNKEREEDITIRMAHDNGMAILKYVEYCDYQDTDTCFSCNKDHSADEMYLFQTRPQCSTCVRSNFIKLGQFEKMKVNCRRCNTDFIVIPSQEKNWNSLKDFIQCPRCDIQFGYNQEIDNAWDTYICELEVQIKSDIKIVNNLEVPLKKELLHQDPDLEKLWNDPSRCLGCARDLSAAQQKRSNYCCKNCYNNVPCVNKNCEGLIKGNSATVPIEILANNQNYGVEETAYSHINPKIIQIQHLKTWNSFLNPSTDIRSWTNFDFFPLRSFSLEERFQHIIKYMEEGALDLDLYADQINNFRILYQEEVYVLLQGEKCITIQKLPYVKISTFKDNEIILKRQSGPKQVSGVC